LVQPGINIENGKTYKVSFEASAANTRTIEVEIASNLHNSSIFATTHGHGSKEARQPFEAVGEPGKAGRYH